MTYLQEALVLSSCKSWAESECQKKQLETSDANLRILLGKILYLVCFVGFFFHPQSNPMHLKKKNRNTMLQRYYLGGKVVEDSLF